MTTLLLVLAITAHLAAADDPPVPVHIVTPTAEFVDEALQARIDSTKDLAGIKWDKKLVRFVETPAEAVVVIEVVGRTTGTLDERKVTRDIVTGQIASEGKRAKSVMVKLTIGEYSTDIIGTDEEDQLGMPPSWTSAAIDARGKVQKWIKTNRAKLHKAP